MIKRTISSGYTKDNILAFQVFQPWAHQGGTTPPTMGLDGMTLWLIPEPDTMFSYPSPN